MGFSDGRNKSKRGTRSENTDPALAALEGVHTVQFLSRNNSATVVQSWCSLKVMTSPVSTPLPCAV